MRKKGDSAGPPKVGLAQPLRLLRAQPVEMPPREREDHPVDHPPRRPRWRAHRPDRDKRRRAVQRAAALGDRRPGENRAFPPLKRLLQRCGSAVVRALSGIDAPDAVTGFRAYSRDAALSITVMTRFSYTVETLIHAGQRGLTVVSVPVETHATPRPSRLARTTRHFVSRRQVRIVDGTTPFGYTT